MGYGTTDYRDYSPLLRVQSLVPACSSDRLLVPGTSTNFKPSKQEPTEPLQHRCTTSTPRSIVLEYQVRYLSVHRRRRSHRLDDWTTTMLMRDVPPMVRAKANAGSHNSQLYNQPIIVVPSCTVRRYQWNHPHNGQQTTNWTTTLTPHRNRYCPKSSDRSPALTTVPHSPQP